MSTEIGVLKDTGSRGVDMNITRFWGGEDVGMSVQLTAKMEDGVVGYIQLSAFDILALIPILLKYIVEEMFSSSLGIETKFEPSEEIAGVE